MRDGPTGQVWDGVCQEVWIPQRDLAAALQVASEGQGYVADIRRVVKDRTRARDDDAVRGAVQETLKYAAKALEVPDEFLMNLRDSLKGQHLQDPFGILHGVDLGDTDDDGAPNKQEPGSCPSCAQPRKEEGRWLMGRERFVALLRVGEKVSQWWMRPGAQEGLRGPAPPWRPRDG